jgi:hypothetical protein
MNDYTWETRNDIPWILIRETIETITIEEGIMRIGNYAFYNHTTFIEISLPESLKTIGNSAFEDCFCYKLFLSVKTLSMLERTILSQIVFL